MNQNVFVNMCLRNDNTSTDFDAYFNGKNATMKVIMQKDFYVRYDKRTKRRYPPDVQAIYDYRKLYEQSFVTFYKTLRPDGYNSVNPDRHQMKVDVGTVDENHDNVVIQQTSDDGVVFV